MVKSEIPVRLSSSPCFSTEKRLQYNRGVFRCSYEQLLSSWRSNFVLRNHPRQLRRLREYIPRRNSSLTQSPRSSLLFYTMWAYIRRGRFPVALPGVAFSFVDIPRGFDAKKLNSLRATFSRIRILVKLEAVFSEFA